MQEQQAVAVVEEVEFAGATLQCTQEGDDVYVSLRRACENMGISHQSQFKKLEEKEWATITQIVTVAEDGKLRELTMLHLDSLPMWLATIDTNRVAEEVRPKLVKYQKECTRVLRDHFFGKPEVEAPQSQSQYLFQIQQKAALAKRLRGQAEELLLAAYAEEALIPDLIQGHLEAECRRLVQLTGIEVGSSAQLALPETIALPETPTPSLRASINRRMRYATFLRHGDCARGEHFRFDWERIATDFHYTYGKNISLCAKNRDTGILDYVEEIGMLPEFASLIEKLIDERGGKRKAVLTFMSDDETLN